MSSPALRVVNGKLPDPPYPADVSANGWRFELDLWRIKQSMTWLRCPVEVRPWLYALWAESWMQIPCGSLPDDDLDIALIIGMPPTLFTVHRDVLMRHWVKHSDGRLYHERIIELVEQMRDGRRKERERKAKNRNMSRGTPAGVPGESHGSPATGTGTGTGTGIKNIVGQEPDRTLREQAKTLLAYLNTKANRRYQPVPANLDFLLARLKSGATAREIEAVIDHKCKEWLADEQMAQYLRPATLFNRTKFAQYLGQLPVGSPTKRVAL